MTDIRSETDEITRLRARIAELERRCSESSRASHMKSQFLANMSHEIRTPMNAVIGMSELLMHTSLSPEQRDLASTLNESAEALLGTINDILDFSKIEAGKIDLELAPFDLTAVVDGCVQLFVQQAQQKRLSLSCFVAPSIPQVLLGDGRYVRRILINLIGNAVKFTASGEVGITVTSRLDGELCICRFEVQDCGIGVSEDQAARLFQPYSQADLTISRRFGGTGLGLAICKHLCEVMGGEIGVVSAPTGGATFWFELPLARVAGCDARKPPEFDGSVLLVNLVPHRCDALSSYLRAWDIPFDCVSTLPEALPKLGNETAFPVVIVSAARLDASMAGFIETASGDRSNPRRFVFAAPVGNNAQSERAIDLGFSRALGMPLRQARFVDCLSNIMHASTSLDCAADAAVNTVETQPRVILVADDNAVNQKVAVLQLRTLGYDSVAVNSGLQVLDAIRKERYALILMDCEMPEMDGFAATRQVRLIEFDRGFRTPIVAMTAHALQGDRDRCLSAGMDDYLSKPVNASRLQEILKRWLPDLSADGDSTLGESGVKCEPPITFNSLRGLCSDTETQDLLQLFLCSARTLMKELDFAIQTYHIAKMKELIYQLRTACTTVGAPEMCHHCFNLERIIETEQWDEIRMHMGALRSSFSVVQDYISRYWRTALAD